jgi:hypothetical protein
MRYNRYYNVPSDWAFTKSEAYRKAVKMFGVNRKSHREGMAGIVYQGDHGVDVYVDWVDLPKATRN